MTFSEEQIEELQNVGSVAWRQSMSSGDDDPKDAWRAAARAVAERAVEMAEKARQQL